MMISTIHEVQAMRYNNLDIKYSWLKGHADKFDREPDKYERLNILAGKICDDIWGPEACGLPKHVHYSSGA
jgi:hypothetical protein